MRRAAALLLVAAAACGDPVPPRLSAIEARIFAPGCTFSACHSTAGHAGGLALTKGRAFAALVNAPAQQETAAREGYVRVVPGDVLRSFLVLKLRAHVEPRYGDRMPQDAEPLDDEALASIEQWIRRGAPDD